MLSYLNQSIVKRRGTGLKNIHLGKEGRKEEGREKEKERNKEGFQII